jgi:hypothetical protein
LLPESPSVKTVSREMGVAVATLQRWRSEARAMPTRDPTWTAAARLEAVSATAGRDEAGKSDGCRQQGVYPSELEKGRSSATAALAEEARASPQQTRQDPRRIQGLERELKRQDKALAETAALRVLSTKLSAIFGEGAHAGSVWKIAKSWLNPWSKLLLQVHGSNPLASSPASRCAPGSAGRRGTVGYRVTNAPRRSIRGQLTPYRKPSVRPS